MKDMQVKDLMTHLVVTLRPDDPLHVAAHRLSRNGISGAPVVMDGKVVGIISESDILRLALAPAHVDRGMSVLQILETLGAPQRRPEADSALVSDAMSTAIVSVKPSTSIWTAATLMERRGIKRLPVVDDDGFLTGIVSRADLVRMMGRPDAHIRNDVVEAIEVLGKDTLGDLDVKVVEGIASLHGTVDRKTTARIAADIASRVPGVVEVHDRLAFEYDDTDPKPQPAKLTSLQDHMTNRDWVRAE